MGLLHNVDEHHYESRTESLYSIFKIHCASKQEHLTLVIACWNDNVTHDQMTTAHSCPHCLSFSCRVVLSLLWYLSWIGLENSWAFRHWAYNKKQRKLSIQVTETGPLKQQYQNQKQMSRSEYSSISVNAGSCCWCSFFSFLALNQIWKYNVKEICKDGLGGFVCFGFFPCLNFSSWGLLRDLSWMPNK